MSAARPTDDLPPSLAEAFQRHALTEGRAAWILVDSERRVQQQGGAYSQLGIQPLAVGAQLHQASEILDALLDPHDDYEVLPRIELMPGTAVDVHRGRLPGGGLFLLLFDVSDDASSETLLRQRGLDLGRLLRGLGTEAFQRSRLGEGWEEALEAVNAEGPARREKVASIRVRIVDQDGPGGIPTTGDPAKILAQRESTLIRVLEALFERTGMAELDGCWTVQSWCGLILGARDPAERALEVAAALPRLFVGDGSGPAPIAIGVAAGPALVGALALPGGRRLCVLGSCAERALVLAEQAEAGQVLVDEAIAQSSRSARISLARKGPTSLGGVAHEVQ